MVATTALLPVQGVVSLPRNHLVNLPGIRWSISSGITCQAFPYRPGQVQRNIHLISYLEYSGKKDKYFATGSGYKTALEAKDIPERHKEFFSNQKLFHIDEKKRCFLHAGFNRQIPFHHQTERDYYWDRTLWSDALDYSTSSEKKREFKIVTKFKEIYIGHTPVTGKPQKVFNIINLDTGAGHSGRLSIMDIDTKYFWQSDPLTELYPENFRN